MNIMYKSLNRYMQLLGEQNGYIKRWVCICLLRNYQSISQSVCIILYSHQHFLRRWTLQRPVCEYVRIWVREGDWTQYFQLSLPVSSMALHLDFYCASRILNSEMLGFNFSRKQVTSWGNWRKGKSLGCKRHKLTALVCSTWQALTLSRASYPRDTKHLQYLKFFMVVNGASQVLQWWRTHLPMQETQEMRVWSLGQKNPLEKEIATNSSIVTWEIPRVEEPGRLQSMGLQKSQTEPLNIYIWL